MLQLDGVKMSKSLGNLVLARNLMEKFEPDQLRLYLLSHHYRANADYRDGDLDRARRRYERLKRRRRGRRRWPVMWRIVNRDVRWRASRTTSIRPAPWTLSMRLRRASPPAADESRSVRAALASLGFAFAGARGPRTATSLRRFGERSAEFPWQAMARLVDALTP